MIFKGHIIMWPFFIAIKELKDAFFRFNEKDRRISKLL